ncbi:MAG TPA: RnfABCDGE type electron transport complex subunit D [Chloroflexota bacterium]|nr:RnfABCDGE type electron transport complex subunit D [Chloroflexota bacterium]
MTGRLRGFFRTPKGQLLLVLLGLTVVALPVEGHGALLTEAAAVATTVAADCTLFAARGKRLRFPSGAILTGLIVAMVLSPDVPLLFTVCSGLVAILSKHVIRAGRGHLLNPAAIGLVVCALALSSEQSWWGGLGNLPAIFILLVALAGLWLGARLNKLPGILTFLGLYFALFTAAALAGQAVLVSDIFQQPFTGAALFFACFMLTDPPTSPARVRDQIWFGGAVALVAFGLYLVTAGNAVYLPLALVAGNLLEGARRASLARAHQSVPRSPSQEFSGAALG